MSVCLPRARSAMWATLVVMVGLVLVASAVSRAQGLDLTPEERDFIAAHPIITLSDSDWRPLSIVENDRWQGLFHDYFSLLSRRTGLAFRFELQGDGRDFQLVLDALRERRIDLIDGTGKTADRARYALFVGPYLRFPLAIMSRDDAPAYSLATLVGRKVAVGRGGTAHEYLKEHGAGVEIVEAEDHAEALAMVATNRVAAAVENMAVAAYAIRASGLSNVKVSGLLDSSFEIYTLVRDDWPLLASIIRKAQDTVTEAERAELLAKWLPIYKDQLDAAQSRPTATGSAEAPTVTRTEREQAYLARKKALAYCIDPDWAPVERIDENGRHEGMTADFLELMRKSLGVPMVLVPTASWSQSLAAVKERRCDFLVAAGNTPQRRRFLSFTTPYLRFPMVVATQSKVAFIDDPAKLAGKPLGVINGYASLDLLRARYPDLRLLEVSSVDEGLRLVAEGKLFGYIDIVPSISRALAKNQYGDLKIAGRLDAHLDLAVASRDDEPELQSLFQKAVNSLDKGASEAIVKKWVAITIEQGFDYTLLWKVLAGGGVILLVVVWWNRKLSRLNRTIQRAHEDLDLANRSLTVLLDNTGQGFLTVGPDGLVDPLYSRECRTLFGVDIDAKPLPELLYPDDAQARDVLAKNIRRILDEPDDYRRGLYLSLMPRLVRRDGATLRLAYRPLAGTRLMFVITDISGEERLRDAVARERNRLACVVAAVRDERDFFTVLDAFAQFRRRGIDQIAQNAGAVAVLEEAYRQIHTFKGLFYQLECPHVARALDGLENRLSGLRGAQEASREAVAAILADTDVDTALERDLDVVRQALGEEFFRRRDQVAIDGALADALAALAGRLLDRVGELGLDPDEETVLGNATTLRYVDVRRLLGSYPRTARRLAQAQGKDLAPFAITGDRVPVDPRRFGPLIKSLVHVFRNAVDHGLETPQQRDAAGKDPAGRLECRVSARGGNLEIAVRDDGRGVDVAAVRARAFELGLGGAEELAGLDEAATLALLFRDGFTSRRDVGALSGRGVGLAAVRVEVERLGGRVTMESSLGRGACLHLVLPLSPVEATREDA